MIAEFTTTIAWSVIEYDDAIRCEIIIQDGQLNSPEYLLFDKENNFFIVDYFNHKILKFDYDVN